MLFDELLAQYLDIYRSELPLDDDLFAYYGALRSTHAYAKVIGARQGVGLGFINDGYAWGMPALFAQITRVIESATGITLDAK